MINAKTLALILLAAVPSIAVAQAEKTDSGSLSTKAMKDQPGNNGAGSTAMPEAKPNSGSLSEKAMKDQPGNASSSGSTDMPTAKEGDGSLTGKAMKDQPGTK